MTARLRVSGLSLGGADLAERVEKVLAEVGLGVKLTALTQTMSGGQAARAGLASLLLSRYDILLLDEPTNDLDLGGLELLERFVAETRAAVVVVSHDREFLARTVSGIVSRPGPAADHRLRRRLRRIPGRTGHRAPACPRGVRGVRRYPVRTRSAGPHAAQLG